MHIHLTGHVIAFELYLSSNSEGLWCLAGLGCFHLLGPGTVTQDLLGIVSLLMAIVNDTVHEAEFEMVPPHFLAESKSLIWLEINCYGLWFTTLYF